MTTSPHFNFDPRSERIARAHRRLAAAYARQPGAEVPVIDPKGSGRGYGAREVMEDLDKMLDHAVAWANNLAGGENDWPPMLDTFCGVCMIAEVFGCKVVYTPGCAPWTEPAITESRQVWSLKPKPLHEAPMTRRLFEWIDHAQREVGTAVPFWTMDLQSPFSVAAHVLEPTELMSACLTDPAAVHHLCQMITDCSIEFMRQHLAQMEHPGFPGRNFPSISDNLGICIADDTPLIMLGPDQYREFALPYNNQIGAAFGGVHIHSCGDYRHNLDVLMEVTNIRSIQLHAGPGEFPLPETATEECPFNRARRRLTLLVDSNYVAHSDRYRDRPKDLYAEYVLPRLGDGELSGCILQSCGAGQDLPDAKAALRWTREQISFRQQREIRQVNPPASATGSDR